MAFEAFAETPEITAEAFSCLLALQRTQPDVEAISARLVALSLCLAMSVHPAVLGLVDSIQSNLVT